MIQRVLTSPGLSRNRSMAAAIVCATLSGCGFTLLMPVVSLNIEAMTGSGLVVGLNGAVAAFSTLLAAPFVPRLMQLLSGRQLVIASLAFAVVCLPLFPAIPNVVAWFVIRFALGFAISIVFVTSETWINQIALPERRATILGMYATALASGFGAGGLLFAWLGHEGWSPWIAGMVLFLAGILPILVLRGPGVEAPGRDEAGLSAMLRAAGAARLAIAAALLFGATETIFFSLIPVYGARIDLPPHAIGLMMAAGAVGGIALQIPIGWLADRFGRSRAIVAMGGVCLAGPALVYLVGPATLPLYLVMFVYVGVAMGLYTVGLSLIGERFTGGSIAAANAAFIFAYGMGSLFAPPTGGAAMDLINPYGLLIMLAGLALVFLVFAAWHLSKQARTPVPGS
tara:strand:+ start:93 stop:1286 length:1194 start_codon:yes stop_codon:yes gene_type:complete